MIIPQELFYTKEHEWIRFDGHFAYVGITDFAQREPGDIVFVDITSLNEEVNSEEVFGTVEAVKTVSDLFMPISAKVIEVNALIDKQPELVNKEPYNNGWLIKISEFDPKHRESLLSPADYKKLIGA